MSKYHQTSNPFENDEDEEDFVVVGKTNTPSSQTLSTTRPSPSSGGISSSSNRTTSSTTSSSYQYAERSNPYSQTSSRYYEEDSPFDDRLEQLKMQIANSENTQLESTQRAIASIYESEAMGVATAEELLRQADTLNNIENKTDSMQQNMKQSQRHLNNIKSVFGGIKNWWSGEKKAPEVKPVSDTSSSRLRATIQKTDKPRIDASGFMDDDDLDQKFMSGTRKPVSGQYTMIQPITRSAREEEIDHNLGLMSDGMSRLKGLAMGLGEEIERQNEQLDRINVKVDRTDDLLTHQNTQMRKILKK